MWSVRESPTQVIYSDDEKLPVLVLQSALLRVVSGQDEGRSCKLSQRRVLVGTAGECDLVLSDPEVSRSHLEFQIQDRGYLVRDLRSTNGTFYRGARVGEVMLTMGSELRIGTTVLRLDRGKETSEAIGCKRQFGGLIGSSRAMQRVYGLLAAVAPTDTSVLIEGETGTGKEVVAEEIHRHSPRKDRLFNVVDCAALPANLIESELFGHEQGAFTGAVGKRIGIFERTHGGTVFLDEIGELPLELQTRLLRVLDQRTIKRVGGDLPRKVDFRLLAATNRDLQLELQQGRFRQDLYFRLAVVRVTMPPLRERIDDIMPLARFFLWQAGCVDVGAVLDDDLLEVLCSRSWPGNVRELRNVLERATILVDGSSDEGLSPAATIGPPPVPATSGPEAGQDSEQPLVLPPTYLRMDYKAAKEQILQQFELGYFRRLLLRHGSNISSIAREAKVDRVVVRKLLRKHKLI
jgi:two-component system nitrogen regulation response regulator GlnG